MMETDKIIAIPPGYTIKEQLESRGMSQKEFAIRMGLTEKHISRLINGSVQLTTDMALKLELVLGINAKFWQNLEAIYREKLLRIENELELEKETTFSKNFPYNEMSKYGWVKKTILPKERVYNLKEFFEVTNLSNLLNENLPWALCRRQVRTDKSDYALMATEQQAKRMARLINTLPINIKGLKSELNNIKKMSRTKPEEFYAKLVNLLANYGIALVVLPHLSGSYLNGVTFIDNKKIIICLTVRGKSADKFWFSLFHELGHIILGHLDTKVENDENEIQADTFARNTLINQDSLNKFVNQSNINTTSIIKFAKDNDISNGIVVGRLQKDEYIKYDSFNDLKENYIIK